MKRNEREAHPEPKAHANKAFHDVVIGQADIPYYTLNRRQQNRNN